MHHCPARLEHIAEIEKLIYVGASADGMAWVSLGGR
jgi:hypothetical protein